MTSGAYTHHKHVWGSPPPGSGSSRDAVCKRCGVRRSAAGPESECFGQHPDAIVDTKHNYDPYMEGK